MKNLPASVEVIDGRRFTLRDVNPADMLDLIEAAGTAAGSAAWMRYAMMLCSVCAIDGKPVMMPHTKDGVRELGRKIGNAGVDALVLAHDLGHGVEQDEAPGGESVKN